MASSVTLTGTGVPHPAPGRAGAGVVVRSGDVVIQFDAGRGTVIRLTEAGLAMHQLNALFLTHVHSDHVIDLADVILTRWIQQTMYPSGPLPIVCPSGLPTRFVNRILEAYDDDIDLRVHHVQPGPPKMDVRSFEPSPRPIEVWRSGDVIVSAVAVHHEPVPDSVAYRIDTPDGAVVISGDTRVCAEVEQLSRGAKILVHEACRVKTMRALTAGPGMDNIFDYHADTQQLGEMAARAGVPHLVLTHLIPVPRNEKDVASFERDVREGGYQGLVTVGRDLDSFEL